MLADTLTLACCFSFGSSKSPTKTTFSQRSLFGAGRRSFNGPNTEPFATAKEFFRQIMAE